MGEREFNLAWLDEASKADFRLQKGDPKPAKKIKETLSRTYAAHLKTGGEESDELQAWLDQDHKDWESAVAERGPVTDKDVWVPRELALLNRDAALEAAAKKAQDRAVKAVQATKRVAATPERGESQASTSAPPAREEEGPAENSEFAQRLRLKEARTKAVKEAVEAICTKLGIKATEEQEAAGELNWGQVLAELGDYAISPSIVEELKLAYEYQGFDARLVAATMRSKGVSPIHKKEGDKAGAYMDRLTLVVIGLMRGANLDKVRKGMKEANRIKFDALVKHYGLQSKPVDSAAITLPRVVATFPGLAMDVLKVMELGPVRHSTMTSLVENYPREMMFSSFPSLIPAGLGEVTEALLSAYLLFQHQVSLVINKDYPKWDVQKQQASLEGFARAAMDSSYVTERQRILRLVEEGWVEVVDGRVVLSKALDAPVSKAAALYRTRK
ncbi:nucleocapsid protein [Fairhair virus]|uniref:Nucleoprotein n=1 Tax=Fairhair virus TaxID=2034330 RepID=A0A286N5Y4_9VIRU|nr:nucleocapsid protein [Fairhair virus]ASY03241.1 nucleocapsid protein [Fairhair virus]